MWLALLIFQAIACTELESKNIACWALCRSDEFDSGYFIEKSNECGCIKKEKFKDISKPKIRIETKKELPMTFSY